MYWLDSFRNGGVFLRRLPQLSKRPSRFPIRPYRLLKQRLSLPPAHRALLPQRLLKRRLKRLPPPPWVPRLLPQREEPTFTPA